MSAFCRWGIQPGVGCRGWMSKRGTPFSCHCARAAEGCALPSENFSDFFISAPLGQWVQSGVTRKQNGSSFFPPALGTVIYTIPMHGAAPSNFLRDLCSPAVGGLCCSWFTVSSRSKVALTARAWTNLSHYQQAFDQGLINCKTEVSEIKDFPHMLYFWSAQHKCERLQDTQLGMNGCGRYKTILTNILQTQGCCILKTSSRVRRSDSQPLLHLNMYCCHMTSRWQLRSSPNDITTLTKTWRCHTILCISLYNDIWHSLVLCWSWWGQKPCLIC